MAATAEEQRATIMAWAEAELERTCTVLFCVLDRGHGGPTHCDATGHSWAAPTPAQPVIAHVYTLPEEN